MASQWLCAGPGAATPGRPAATDRPRRTATPGRSAQPPRMRPSELRRMRPCELRRMRLDELRTTWPARLRRTWPARLRRTRCCLACQASAGPPSVLVAAAVCPHPPLLVPEVMGAAGLRPGGEMDAVRSACDAAVTGLAAAEPDLVVVIGGADT